MHSFDCPNHPNAQVCHSIHCCTRICYLILSSSTVLIYSYLIFFTYFCFFFFEQFFIIQFYFILLSFLWETSFYNEFLFLLKTPIFHRINYILCKFHSTIVKSNMRKHVCNLFEMKTFYEIIIQSFNISTSI